MSMAPTNIATGNDIYTRDGEKLGTVKAVRADAFQVAASMQPDYWLRLDCVDGGDTDGSGRVTVAFDKDHLDDYKEKRRDEDM